METKKRHIEMNCIKALAGRNWIEKLDFRLFQHAELLWRVIHWNWFDIGK